MIPSQQVSDRLSKVGPVGRSALLDDDVRLAVYRFFVEEGRPPVASEIADSVRADPIDVEAAFRRLHEAHVLVLAPGTPYIWMANPLSALPTPYRVVVDGKRFWGNCIWDALGVVAMLGGTGSVLGRCPDCGESLEVTVQDREVAATRDYVVHFAVAAALWWDDIGFN